MNLKITNYGLKDEMDLLCMLIVSPIHIIDYHIKNVWFLDTINHELFNMIYKEFIQFGSIMYEKFQSKHFRSLKENNILISDRFILLSKHTIKEQYFTATLDRVINRYHRNEINNFSSTLNKMLTYNSTPTSDVLNFIEGELLRIAKLKDHGSIVDINTDIYKKCRDLVDNQGSLLPNFHLQTGISKLDNILGGIGQDEIVILAARPAVGKTSFAINNILSCVRQSFNRVVFFSLEMSKWSIYTKILGNLLNKNSQSFRGSLSFDSLQQIQEELRSLIPSNYLYVIDGSEVRREIRDIKTQVRLLSYRHKIDVIFIDYIQLIRSSQYKEKHLELNDIMMELKYLAKELQVPIIILSQLSRQTAAKDTPGLEDIKYSGAIEEHADKVLFLHNKNSINSRTIIIAKNRLGNVGQVEVEFNPELSKFF